jgi:hypothetical protein
VNAKIQVECNYCRCAVYRTPESMQRHMRLCPKAPASLKEELAELKALKERLEKEEAAADAAPEPQLQLTLVPPAEEAKAVIPQEGPMESDQKEAEEKEEKKERNGVGKWLTMHEVVERYDYSSGFWYGRAASGDLRRKAVNNNEFVYSSADAKLIAETARVKPHKKPGRSAAKAEDEVAELAKGDHTDIDVVKRLRYLVLGVELGELTKSEAFDRLAKLVEEIT